MTDTGTETLTIARRPVRRRGLASVAAPGAVGAGAGTAFGTFGELLQGVLEPGLDFLVTMPIARSSSATFRLDPTAGEVRVDPAGKHKSLRLARMILARCGITAGGLLRVDSQLPEGKGLASSSADLVATARAVGQAVGLTIGPAQIESLLRAIEPSDGVMYPGAVAFYHREVRLRARLGELPPLTVVGIDEGGVVDTIAFNQRPKPFTARDRREYARLLAAVAGAIRRGDAAGIGQVASRSAVLNQRLCPKRTLGDLLGISRSVAGLGVVTAHSGTALGVLLATGGPGYREQLHRTVQACAGLAAHVWVEHSVPPAGARTVPPPDPVALSA